MTSRVIEEYLADVRKNLTHLLSKERDAVIAEMRAHLDSEIERRIRDKPELSYDEAALVATHEFGEPAEIGTQYASPRPPKQPKRWIPVLATGVACLLLGLMIGVALTEEGAYAGARTRKRTVEHYQRNWGTLENDTTSTGDEFTTKDQVETFWFEAAVYGQAGCGRVRLFRSGVLVVGNSSTCNDDVRLEFPATGVFRIEYDFRNFTGRVQVRAYTDVTEYVG